jgi:hypothetical protein
MLVSEHTGIPLDTRVAQSSVNHMIIRCGSFCKKVDILCEGASRDIKNVCDSIPDYIRSIRTTQT